MRLIAIERLISCGGAAGSLDTEVLLAPAGAEEDATVVVATTGPVYEVRWRDPQTLVVEVSPVDDIGDPVSEYVERWENVRVVLVRRAGLNNGAVRGKGLEGLVT